MDKTITITWALLLVLTIATSLFSNMDGGYVKMLIMILACLKFLGVAFQFMELKKAHSFWKIIVLSYLTIFIALVLIAKL